MRRDIRPTFPPHRVMSQPCPWIAAIDHTSPSNLLGHCARTLAANLGKPM